MKLDSFKKRLEKEELSNNSIIAYMYAVEDFWSKYPSINMENLQRYKVEQMDKYSPRTVNLRIQAINRYANHIGKPRLKLKSLKIQQKTYLENVISNADYCFLKTKLKEEGELTWYFIVRFLGATGARVSELVEFKAEHISEGFFDLYTKGGKCRRLFIPKELRIEAEKWIELRGIRSGYLFVNSKSKQVCQRKIRYELQKMARRYGINPKVMHPHSFRHRYAKNFLEAYNDISLLADLMGHESIETTRIYLRRTSDEQRDIVDKVITW